MERGGRSPKSEIFFFSTIRILSHITYMESGIGVKLYRTMLKYRKQTLVASRGQHVNLVQSLAYRMLTMIAYQWYSNKYERLILKNTKMTSESKFSEVNKQITFQGHQQSSSQPIRIPANVNMPNSRWTRGLDTKLRKNQQPRWNETKCISFTCSLNRYTCTKTLPSSRQTFLS